MVHKEPVQLLLLGTFLLRCGRRPVGSLPRKAQALLAYLALHRGRSFKREQLAALLWGNSGNEQARRSLRQCLMSVRSALGAAASESLIADGDQITLSADGGIDVDVGRFVALGASSKLDDLRAASEIYREEFLAGMQIAAESFSDWVAVERRRLSSMMSDVLHRLAVAQAAAGEVEPAINTAKRLTDLDPLREDAHRLLMRLLASAGRRGAALKEYATCGEILQRELGVAPEPETTHLVEAIRRGEIGARTSAPHEPSVDRARARRVGIASEATEQRLKLPDKPSIAVMPFNNLSGDTGQDYFADGIVEDMSIALGRVPWLFVIASSATSLYRGSALDARRIGAELGVRYLLRGSLRRAGDRVRIVVQLTDASTSGHLWAERFEGHVDNVFEIQDRVTSQVAAMIAPAVYAVEMERAQRKAPESLTAYDFYLRALRRFRVNLDENREALKLLRRAIDLDPEYGTAYGLAARCYQMQKVFGWLPPTDPELLVEGPRLARSAVQIGSSDSEALWMAGHVLAYINGELEHGLTLIEKSLTLNPSSASAWISSCFVRCYLPGETESALEHFSRAQRLNPLDSMHHIHWTAAAEAYFVAG
jgi:TolB-like protein